ncbi:MAG: ABC transporter permease, partial [Muribaculaceae bacterium]|nr:ABC transporter permease [Muribaculaceae bacterium]
REQSHVDIAQTIRNFVICALFLLVVIFLGFLGTFWFRTQQRVGEIAVRKVNGATNSNIFTRFISEGLILFAISALIAVIIIIAVISTGILDDADIPLNGYKYFYGGFIVTAISMSALIICGIWAPARRATRINPSYALKDQ